MTRERTYGMGEGFRLNDFIEGSFVASIQACQDLAAHIRELEAEVERLERALDFCTDKALAASASKPGPDRLRGLQAEINALSPRERAYVLRASATYEAERDAALSKATR